MFIGIDDFFLEYDIFNLNKLIYCVGRVIFWWRH